ncbi:MAG: hypothetical protein V2L15_11080 [Desulfobacteraceae bacterium]|nr:hypothetical protein [Desulfobacteraceae bacterium]
MEKPWPKFAKIFCQIHFMITRILGRTFSRTVQSMVMLFWPTPAGPEGFQHRFRHCDPVSKCPLCFALPLWNNRDPILKERLFGLTGPESNKVFTDSPTMGHILSMMPVFLMDNQNSGL